MKPSEIMKAMVEEEMKYVKFDQYSFLLLQIKSIQAYLDEQYELSIPNQPMEKTYYALYTKRGHLLVIDVKLPIYWRKEVAIEQAKLFRAIVKKASVTINPVEDVTNYNQPMAMKKGTYPAKKKAVVAKKVVKKAGKK